jgi:DNA-binding response OmpR family regulator
MKQTRVLIIEDNVDIAENIGDFLEGSGHIADFAVNGSSGLYLALSNTYDVIILDLKLPDMDGIEVCKKIRKTSDTYTPILILTARDTLDDKLTGFKAGADDYLVKPFALQELAARINVLAKREKIFSPTLLKIGDLTLDQGALIVKRADQTIELNKTCLMILKILMRASPNIVSRQELEHAIWEDMPPGSDALRSHMYTLRQKIDKPFKTNLIQTVHGIGYKIVG